MGDLCWKNSRKWGRINAWCAEFLWKDVTIFACFTLCNPGMLQAIGSLLHRRQGLGCLTKMTTVVVDSLVTQGFRTSAAMALTSFFLVARRWDINQGQWPGYTMPDGDYSGGGVSVGDIYMRRIYTWWRHQRQTCSALPALCAGNSPVTGEFPSQRLVTRNFGVFFYLRLNNRGLSKKSWGWWFETPSRPLWRHCNVPTELDWRRQFLHQ